MVGQMMSCEWTMNREISFAIQRASQVFISSGPVVMKLVMTGVRVAQLVNFAVMK